jgi:uncharacterized protein
VSPEIDLTAQQRDELRRVFIPYANRIDAVAVYGSRATGSARAGSDVDLVIYGDAEDQLIDRIRTELGESDLSIFADITAYRSILHAPLKEQIDAHAKTLFEKADLV